MEDVAPTNESPSIPHGAVAAVVTGGVRDIGGGGVRVVVIAATRVAAVVVVLVLDQGKEIGGINEVRFRTKYVHGDHCTRRRFVSVRCNITLGEVISCGAVASCVGLEKQKQVICSILYQCVFLTSLRSDHEAPNGCATAQKRSSRFYV